MTAGGVGNCRGEKYGEARIDEVVVDHALEFQPLAWMSRDLILDSCQVSSKCAGLVRDHS